MTRGRLAVEEVFHLVPADPGTAAVVVRLDGVGAFLLQDRLAIGRRRRVRLQDPEPRPGQDRRVGRLQALIDGAVGGTEDLDDGDAVERIHGVDEHGAQERRQIVAAALQPGAEPMRLGIEDTALLEVPRRGERQIPRARESVCQVLRQQVRPAAAVPVLPDDARPFLREVFFRCSRSGTAELLAAGRGGVVELEIQVDRPLRELGVESEVEGRRLVLVWQERLEEHVGRVQIVGVIPILEVVVARAARDRLRLAHVLEHQRLETRRPQRAILLEHPVLADQLVRSGSAIVAGVDAGADPEVLLPAHFDLHHVEGTIEADRAVAGEGAARVEEIELTLHP